MTTNQKLVKEFNEINNLNMPIEHRALDLVSEIGELSKEILLMTNYGRNPLKKNTTIQSEIGDVFYALIATANHFDIDLNEALEQALSKYEQRLQKGTAGSEK